MNDDDLRARLRRAIDSVHRPAPDLLERSVEAVRKRGGRRLVPTLAWVAISLVILAAGALVLAQREWLRSQAPSTTPAPQQPVIYTLTAANRLIAFDSGLHVIWQRDAGPAPSGGNFVAGSLMHLSPDHSVIYVVPLVDLVGGTEIRSFDAATGQPRATVALSHGDARYRALAVDSGGDVYAVGEDATHILVTVVDPDRHAVITTRATRNLPPKSASSGADLPFQAELSPDGRRLYYSFGGTEYSRAGIDWVTINGTTLSPCTAQQPTAACLPGYPRGFSLRTGRLIAVDSTLANLVENTLDGAPLRRLANGVIPGMENVVVDEAGNAILLLGSCASSGGLVRVDLATGEASAVVTPQPAGAEVQGTTCGSRAVLLSDDVLVAAALPTSSANPNGPGSIQLIDTRSGRVVGQVATGADPVDIVVAR